MEEPQRKLSLSSSSNEYKQLRKTQSLPQINSRNDSGVGFSAAGSCSVLDQIGNQTAYIQYHQNKLPYGHRLVTDFRQLVTLRQHYYPEGGWGWLLTVIGFFVQCLAHGLHMSVGIFVLQLADRFQKPTLYVVFLVALSQAIALLVSPITIAMCKRKSTRIVAVIGGLVISLGFLFTSFASQFHQLFLSYGIIFGVGVGMTRDCSTLMVAQYFKRKREFVEIFQVSGSGMGCIVMSTMLTFAVARFGWRLGLQAVTTFFSMAFFLGMFYRSASLYHPQRRAILHLKTQRRKIKDKNKQDNRPPFFDVKTLKSKTVRIILSSIAVSALGINTPIFFIAYEIENETQDDKLVFQIYLGLAWMLGCMVFGMLVVRNSVECRIGRQYLCQASLFVCSICLLALTGVQGNHQGYVMFTWIYGIFYGGYNYSLKVYIYERVRARNFACAWSYAQLAQSVPLVIGVVLTGFLNQISDKSGYYFSAFCALLGCGILFLVDIHKRNLTRHKHMRANGALHLCVLDECPQSRKLSFSQEPENDPGVLSGSLIMGSDVISHQMCGGDELAEPINPLEKPELTCISEEGIADMDLPDNLFEDIIFDAECITSCNKVEKYLMLRFRYFFIEHKPSEDNLFAKVKTYFVVIS